MYEAGEKYGQLQLIERIPYRNASGKLYHKWKCICDCGKETVVFESNIGKTQSCGHLIAEKVSDKHLDDLTNQRFGRLTVIKRAKDRTSSSGRTIVQWECVCDCGNHCFIDACELRKGSTVSCGCYRKEQNNSKAENLVGLQFGKLTVISKAQSVKYGNSYMSNWVCRCQCGSVVSVLGTVLRRGQISCGCVNSKGEEKIANMLSERKIPFERQKTYKDLVSEYTQKELPFDFCIKTPDKADVLIEYQGVQHYVPQSNHFGDYQREYTDNQKREYCTKQHIPLYEIRYDENIEERIDNILSAIYGNTVPRLCEE